MALTFPLHRNPNPTPAAEVAQILADPGFGDHFTDHMAVAIWEKDAGWAAAEVKPYGPFQMDPAANIPTASSMTLDSAAGMTLMLFLPSNQNKKVAPLNTAHKIEMARFIYILFLSPFHNSRRS